jgi:hypothetical protein
LAFSWLVKPIPKEVPKWAGCCRRIPGEGERARRSLVKNLWSSWPERMEPFDGRVKVEEQPNSGG